MSFSSPSSDFVKLASITPSDANTISIDGYFTSNYDVYKMYFLGMTGTSMSVTRLSFRVNVSGTAQTSNYYHATHIGALSSLTADWSNGTNSGDSDLGYVHDSNLSTSHGNVEMTIFRPLDTDKTQILHEMLAWDGGIYFGRYFGATAYNSASAISGITLGCGDFGSGNLQISRILVYGLKI